jgi:16S rRNA G966 N2-methylase RsmD
MHGVLDAFAGTGAAGTRGAEPWRAEFATFVERDRM